MSARALILATTALLGLLSTEAMADDLIHLADGRFYHGTIASSTWESITVKVMHEGKEETHVVPAKMCDPYWYYSVRDKHLGNDAKGRIKLAVMCAEHDMFSRAKAQMDKARATDPKAVEEFMKNEFPKIKEGLADRLLKAGQRSLRRGSTKNALRYASLILTKFEGTKAEAGAEKLHDEAQKMVDEKEAKDRARRRKAAADKEAREAKAIETKRDNILGPIEKLIDQGQEHSQKGLKAKGLNDTKSQLEVAAKRFESAIKRCDDALKGDLNQNGTKAIQESRAEAVQGAVSAYLSLASTYSSRGNYNKGTQYCNKALAIDPSTLR